MLGPLLAALLSPIALNAPYWAGALVIVVGFATLMFRRPSQPWYPRSVA